jgi:hypothetical protein
MRFDRWKELIRHFRWVGGTIDDGGGPLVISSVHHGDGIIEFTAGAGSLISIDMARHRPHLAEKTWIGVHTDTVTYLIKPGP